MSHVDPTPSRARPSGFTIVELVIAVIILSFGVLGLAGTTAFVIRQVTLADVNTERSAAVQEVLERLRATNANQITTGSATVGAYTVAWAVTDSSGSYSRTVRVISTGPGLNRNASTPRLANNVADTITFVRLEL